MKKKLFLPFLLLHFSLFCQEDFPINYFRSPLDIPLSVSGTFGELRSNHFHAGIDLKTNKRIGLPVYATAEGYVSRIKISVWGYGKVIYIKHPNGFSTVYAHLSKFGKGIEEYVKRIQYFKKSYETGNIYPKKGEILVEKGQIIGYSGRTGGFVAPHLHYEVRDKQNKSIINPLLFGLKVKDSIAPTINKLMAYPIGANSRINRANKKQILPLRKKGDNEYFTNRISAFGKISFGINTFDRLGKELNKNGVYSIEMLVNGKRYYYHNLETFSFAESKYINLLIDYFHYAKHKSKIQKTFKQESNQLSIYKDLVNDGVLEIKEGLNYLVKIVVKDFKGNTSTIKIPIVGIKNNPIFQSQIDTTNYKINKSEFHKFTQNGVTIAFPKNTFYEDVYLDFTTNGNIANIHRPTIPLDKSFTITFDSTLYNKSDIDHIYIANINNEKYPIYQKTRKKENKIFTTTKILGKYTILIDDQIPKIYGCNFNNDDWISNYRNLTIKISDTQSGIQSYDAFIDDQWILMEYDVKLKKLTYDFNDKKLVGSKHIFKLVVSDNVGNTNIYESTFYRKQ